LIPFCLGGQFLPAVSAIQEGPVISRPSFVSNKLFKTMELITSCFNSKPSVHRVAAAIVLTACTAAAPAFAQITFDGKSQGIGTAGATSVSFSHVLGAGSDRLLVCGVQISNPTTNVVNVTPTVTFNGIAMTAIPSSQAPSTSEATTGKIESEMFYLGDTGLASLSGSYAVNVSVPTAPQGSVGAACVSFFGVAHTGPEAVAEKYNGNNPAPAVSFTTTSVGDLIIDSFAGGFNLASTGKAAIPSAGQTQLTPAKYQLAAGGILIGSSYLISPTAGAVSLNPAWTADGLSTTTTVNVSRSAYSVVAFAPATPQTTCNLTVNSTGTGAGTVSPKSGPYICGTRINLSATATSGSVFTSWSGTGSGNSYSGSSSSTSFVLDQDATETATFTLVPMCTLTASVAAGAGTIVPASGSSYPCGTQLTMQAFPAAQNVFASWGGALTGNTNPTTLTLNTDATVTATFNQNNSNVTGDSRTVVEPQYPPVCSTLTAQQIDSSLQESLADTARVQAALNACSPGQAVEFSSDGTNNAFIIAPITLPPGVTMLVDPEVTIFGSIQSADYSCNASSGWCTPLINVLPNTDPAPGSGIMGLGVIDGRGGVPLTDTGTSWWASLNSGTDARPRLVYLGDNNTHAPADNFTLYKITLRNSPKFHVSGVGNNFTVWGIRIIAPPDSPNTDGIDPSGSKNVTITNSYISDGDDHIAPKAGVAHVSNLTISNNHLYSGHGVSVGSETNAGLNNMYVHDNAIDIGPNAFGGNSADSLRIKSDVSRGGEVYDVLYENTCINYGGNTLVFDPYYSAASGSLIPNFHDITIRNLRQLQSTNKASTMRGYHDASSGAMIYPLTLTLDNVYFDNATASAFNSLVNNAEITLGPGPVNIASTLQTDAANAANNLAVYNNVTNSNQPLDCSNAFVYLTGDLTAPTKTAVAGQPFTVKAVLQNVVSPVVAGTASYPQQNMPTGTIQLMEGTTVAASATISTGSRLTGLTIPTITPGQHTYTAQYQGDTNYPGTLNFGSFTVTSNLPAPVANGQSVKVSYNTPASITLSATGNGTLTYSVVAAPAHGTLSGIAPNLIYTPNSSYAGTDSFTFKANNGTDSNVATVNITVANAAPVANSQSVTVTYNTAKQISLSVIGSGTLTYSVVVGPSHGTLSGTAPNLTYTPVSGYAGTDSFTFKANNGLDSNIATVSITVNAGITGGPATGGSLTATVPAGQPALFSLQFAGWTGATGTMTFGCTGAPPNGTCTVTPGSATLSGTTPIQVSVLVTTATTTASLREAPAPLSGRGKGLPVAVLAGLLGFTFSLRRRRSIVRLLQAVVLCIALSAVYVIAGCGGSSGGAQTGTGSKASAGTYPITVTATASGVTQNVNLTLTVQ
jgi:polygalacturonase